MARVLIVYYSSYGHTFELARAVVDGVTEAGSEPVLRRVPELAEARKAMSSQTAYVKAQEAQKDIPEVTHDDLRSADGVVFGTPTRYGNMTAQLKQFLDTTGSIWSKGELEDKAAGVFTSTATTHGGMETTILTTLIPLLHLGMVFCGNPYGMNPQLFTDEGIGGSPYGPGTIAGPDGTNTPAEEELAMARHYGMRIALVAEALKAVREERKKKERAA